MPEFTAAGLFFLIVIIALIVSSAFKHIAEVKSEAEVKIAEENRKQSEIELETERLKHGD
jgi:hypothetical protein